MQDFDLLNFFDLITINSVEPKAQLLINDFEKYLAIFPFSKDGEILENNMSYVQILIPLSSLDFLENTSLNPILMSLSST